MGLSKKRKKYRRPIIDYLYARKPPRDHKNSDRMGNERSPITESWGKSRGEARDQIRTLRTREFGEKREKLVPDKLSKKRGKKEKKE